MIYKLIPTAISKKKGKISKGRVGDHRAANRDLSPLPHRALPARDKLRREKSPHILPHAKKTATHKNRDHTPRSWAERVSPNLNHVAPLPTPTGAATPQTFHTAASDTVAPLPFENPPHLQLTERFSGSKLAENGIMFKMFFPSGDLVTRACILKFRTIVSDQVRNKLGAALTRNDHGDPITVFTKRVSPSSSMCVGHH